MKTRNQKRRRVKTLYAHKVSRVWDKADEIVMLPDGRVVPIKNGRIQNVRNV